MRHKLEQVSVALYLCKQNDFMEAFSAEAPPTTQRFFFYRFNTPTIAFATTAVTILHYECFFIVCAIDIETLII
jgi:hypothetical protein